jgi:molecular chaperone GrpE
MSNYNESTPPLDETMFPDDALSATADVTENVSPDATTTPTPSDELSGAAAELVQVRAELATLQARFDELTDKNQRMAAEFQNTRRRQEKALADEIERASTHLIKRLLPAVDDLALAFNNVPAAAAGDSWVEGFRQIQKKLLALLEEEGVSAIPAEGEFDPMLHEAVMSEPSETVESGHITGLLRGGYLHKGRVLRPALVRVAL